MCDVTGQSQQSSQLCLHQEECYARLDHDEQIPYRLSTPIQKGSKQSPYELSSIYPFFCFTIWHCDQGEHQYTNGSSVHAVRIKLVVSD